MTAADTRAVIDAHACAHTCQLQSDTVNKEVRGKAQIRTYARMCALMHKPVSKHKQTQAWFDVEVLHIS